MKLVASTVASAFTAAALVAAAGPSLAAMDDITPQEKALIEPAKTEGAVTLINALFQERTADRLASGFKQRY
ncbi:unnamed protein product, partial [Discosporangium mesarthrocarpum]